MVCIDGPIERSDLISFNLRTSSFFDTHYVIEIVFFWSTQIKSIQRRMSVASGRLRSNDAEERANAQIEIQRLQEEMAAACAGLTR